MMLDPNNFYESGNLANGKLTRQLRSVNAGGSPGLLALVTAIKVRGTADGTVAALVTAATDLETQLSTPATLDKIVEPY